ncbi:1-phosphofructokinase family hexose kinase [Canibacter zhoujuaniae]|uniref:1-phosphofructokinase family hexose kinase n=1 Tax=Canibacter zhoujuaniae TaxID=2708343 RepID=UPI00141E8D5E|nr:hexose kinase [Canibacter zhoujuaniae]
MIITLTPNPALDLTYRLDALQFGESHRTAPALERAGGKGLNVARILHGEGQPVRAIAPLGGRRGLAIYDLLSAAGIDTDVVPIAAETRRTIAIVTDDDTTNINEEGPALSSSEWGALESVITGALPGARVLVCSGSLPQGTPGDFIPKLISACKAVGVRTIVDAAGEALLAACAAGADVVKPNVSELLNATNIADPREAAEHLLNLGAKCVVASLGEKGMVLFTAGHSPLAGRLPEPLVGNTTGAGDAAVAAIAKHFAESDSPDAVAMLKDAVAWSAGAVLAEVAGEIVHDAQLTEKIILNQLESH